MFRKFLSLVPALTVLFALSGAAEAGRISPQQKAAATKEFAKRAKKQFGPEATVKVKYAGPTGRDASIKVLGAGRPTNGQKEKLIGIGTGRVVVHRKPALIKKDGVVDTNLKGGRYEMVFSILPVFPSAE